MPALTLCIAAVTLGLAPGAAQAAPVAPPRYHAATNVVADGGRVWATPSAVYRVDPPASFRFYGFNYGVGPDAIKVAPDERTLCVKRMNDVFVLELRTLRLVRRYDTPNVWWQRGRWRSMEAQAELNGVVVLGVDIESGYGFADRVIAAGTERNGFLDTHRLFLVRCSDPRSVQVLSPLVDTEYDPASVEYPYMFRVGARGVAVFGFPYMGADMLDSVGASWGGHLRAPVEDGHGHPLLFEAQPVRAGRDVVGLAWSARDLRDPIEESPKYLFRVSPKGITVRPVATDVVLVTYDDRRKRLGVGHKRQGYVEVDWTE